MVVAEAAGALASSVMGVSNLWGYNRDNFLYDRKMRQKTELKVAQWRAEQAGQWREDVRDLTGLTESKMASYMTVNTLQLSMCVLLFAEGRLQPGTPHWLLHLYMLTLSAAFMYLLMSVWLAMHASVVVACEKARLLTQFVRLPIPTWQQFEHMRTSAAAYENLGGRSLRLPFIDTVFEKPDSERSHGYQGSHNSDMANAFDEIHGQLPMSASGMARVEETPNGTLGHGAVEGFNDTWGLETHGDEVHELAERPLHSNRHVNLVRRAQTHYQCHDAFARISMTFGTNQLLMALSYFCLGYVSVGDGAPWPAMIITIVMTTINVLICHMDVSFAREQRLQAVVLMSAGPFLSSVSAVAWCTSDRRWQIVPAVLLPPAYLAHGLWLLFALRACQVQLLPGGEMLPTKFRLVMYLDVFGWIQNQIRQTKSKFRDEPGEYMPMPYDGLDAYSPVAAPSMAQASRLDSLEGARHGEAFTSKETRYIDSFRKSNAPLERARLIADIRQTLESWQSDDMMQKIDSYTKNRVDALSRCFSDLGETVTPLQAWPHGVTEFTAKDRAEALSAVYPRTGDERDRDTLSSLLLPLDLGERDLISEIGAASELSVETEVLDHCTTSPVLAPSPLITRAFSGEQEAADQWVKGSYCTDFGTEVAYDYDPRTGKVRGNAYASTSPEIQPIGSPVTFTPFGTESTAPTKGGEFNRGAERCLSHDSTSSVFNGHPLLRSLSIAEDDVCQLKELQAQHEIVERLEEKLRLRELEARHVRQARYPSCSSSPLVETSRTQPLKVEDFIRNPKQFAERLRHRSAHMMAEALPWLFGDVEPDAGFDLADREASGSRHDCPDEVVVNSRGQTEKAHDASDKIDSDEIVIAMAPDKIPWQVFRYSTLLLVCIWLISPLLLYGWYPYGRSEFGPQPPIDMLSAETKGKSFAEKEDPDGTFSGMVVDNRDMDYDLEPSIDQYESMPSLPAGQLLHVHWPFESSFTPRAMTCDKTGKHIIVSDDFGVYSAKVVDGPDGVKVKNEERRARASTSENAEEQQRRLRGHAREVQPSSFSQMPHCTALEGKQLKDVAVVCGRGGGYCRVVVLHSNGRRLTECPLHSTWGTVSANAALEFTNEEQGLNPSSDRPVVRPLSEWRISGSWLDHDRESVESLAVNPECPQAEGQHAFDPAEVGCVVVGTSSGRVVQLRRHVSKDHDLVPEWAMQERRGKVAQGSLQVYPDNLLLMLRSEIGLVQAIDAEKGSLMGQWRLPDNAEWFSISGGGSSLFMLGREKVVSDVEEEKNVFLWKFPLPPELQKLFAEG